jgi:hypothetical protein
MPGPVTEIEIDIALDGTPDQTPAVASSSGQSGDEEHPNRWFVPTLNSGSDEAVMTEDAFFTGSAVIEPLQAEPEPDRPSVQADTVRVQVIPYTAFPRWAVVMATASLVFVAGLVAFRAGLPDLAPSTRAVHVSPTALPNSRVATPPPVTVSPPSIPGSANSNVAANVVPVASGEGAGATPVVPLQPRAESAFDESSPSDRAIAPVPPPSPAGKIQVAPSRRRRGTGDFFRDPGF